MWRDTSGSATAPKKNRKIDHFKHFCGEKKGKVGPGGNQTPINQTRGQTSSHLKTENECAK